MKVFSNLVLRKIYTTLFLILFVSCCSFAQSFTASSSGSKVGLSEQFQVTFTFSGEEINGMKSFKAPNFKDFMPLSGPNQSTNMTIINGAVSASRSFTYILQPRQLGKFTIGSATVDYKGKTFQSNPIHIEVVKGGAQQSQQGGGAKGKNPKSDNVSQKEIGENLFIRASADRQQVLKGEQINVTYKLYTRLNIASLQVSKLPSYPGFWAEENEIIQNINFTNETVNGKQYKVATLKKVALFPTETGQLSVTPFELKIPVYVQKKSRSNNPFDDFFNDPFSNRPEVVDYTAISNTIKVNVQGLPQSNASSSFTGAVGDFSMKVEVDKKSVKTNEPIKLKIKISGTGNIKLITLPEFDIPAGFEKYDPKTSDDLTHGAKIGGSKTAEYLLIPRFAGKKEIPPVKFTFYNTAKRQYQTITSEGFTIDVAQGEGGSGSSGGEVQMLNDDIQYIKTNAGDIKENGSFAFESFWFWLLCIIPLAGFIWLLIFRKREDKLSSNMQLLRYQKAQKMAKKRLKTAGKYLASKNEEKFYAELSNALFGYLENKLGIAKAEFTLENALEELKNRNVPDELVEALMTTARKCEFIRFAPSNGDENPMQSMYDESVRIIIDIEKSLA